MRANIASRGQGVADGPGPPEPPAPDEGTTGPEIPDGAGLRDVAGAPLAGFVPVHATATTTASASAAAAATIRPSARRARWIVLAGCVIVGCCPAGVAPAGRSRRIGDRRLDRGLPLDRLGHRRAADLLGEVAGGRWPAPTCRRAGSSVDAALRVAEPLAQPAPRVEPAARRRCGRRRDVALEDEALLAATRVGVRDRREEGDRVRVARIAVQLLDRAELDDPAEVHDPDPVAEVLDRPTGCG